MEPAGLSRWLLCIYISLRATLAGSSLTPARELIECQAASLPKRLPLSYVLVDSNGEELQPNRGFQYRGLQLMARQNETGDQSPFSSYTMVSFREPVTFEAIAWSTSNITSSLFIPSLSISNSGSETPSQKDFMVRDSSPVLAEDLALTSASAGVPKGMTASYIEKGVLVPGDYLLEVKFPELSFEREDPCRYTFALNVIAKPYHRDTANLSTPAVDELPTNRATATHRNNFIFLETGGEGFAANGNIRRGRRRGSSDVEKSSGDSEDLMEQLEDGVQTPGNSGSTSTRDADAAAPVDDVHSAKPPKAADVSESTRYRERRERRRYGDDSIFGAEEAVKPNTRVGDDSIFGDSAEIDTSDLDPNSELAKIVRAGSSAASDGSVRSTVAQRAFAGGQPQRDSSSTTPTSPSGPSQADVDTSDLNPDSELAKIIAKGGGEARRTSEPTFFDEEPIAKPPKPQRTEGTVGTRASDLEDSILEDPAEKDIVPLPSPSQGSPGYNKEESERFDRTHSEGSAASSGVSEERRPPAEEELARHEHNAERIIRWSKEAASEACEFKLDGECVTPLQCEERLCHNHGYCTRYSNGPGCSCDPGYASSGGQFCNVCESDLASYPSCAIESMGDKIAESLAMERVCNVFEVPYNLDKPGMLMTRHSVSYRDWFLVQTKSTTTFTLAKESHVRLHTIPGDPRDILEIKLIDQTENEVLIASSKPVDTPYLSHEAVLLKTVPEGSYRIEILFEGDPGDSDKAGCKRFHFQFAITPVERVLDPSKPYQCSQRETFPKIDTAGFGKEEGEVVVVGKEGLEYVSQPGKLVTGLGDERHRGRIVWSLDFKTERYVRMVPYVEATLSSDFLTGHLRLVIHRLDSENNSILRDGYPITERDGYSAEEVASAAEMSKMLTASAQVFVANNDADENRVAMDLEPRVVYRITIFQVAPRLRDTTCLFYDLSLAVNYVNLQGDGDESAGNSQLVETEAEVARERFEDGFVDDKCTLAALPRTFNIPGYLGYTGSTMHTHEVFRYNPNVQEHAIAFEIHETSLLRLYVPFHQTQLTIHMSVLDGKYASTKPLAQASNSVNDDITTELAPGKYRVVFQIEHADTLVRSPGSMRCVGFVAEIAIAPTAILGGGHHWCGPSKLEKERLPEFDVSDGITAPNSPFVLVAGGLSENRIPFKVEKEKMRLKLSIDSDFVTGHIGALIQEKSGPETREPRRSRASRRRAGRSGYIPEVGDEIRSGETKIIIPSHQSATNHGVLDHVLAKGEYDLILRPLFIYAKRVCVPFDLSVDLVPLGDTGGEAKGSVDAEFDHEDELCEKGGFEMLPVTLNTPRFLGGSGQSHLTHFAGSFFTPSGEDQASIHFSVAKRSDIRVAITFNPFGGVAAAWSGGVSKTGGKHGARFALLYYDCMSQSPPYPYVHVSYFPKGYTCHPKVIWEDLTTEFSRLVTIDPGYYRLVVSHHHHGDAQEKVRDQCIRFHMELAVNQVPVTRSRGAASESEGRCPYNADHLPPHPPEVLAMSYHYDSQIREEKLAYQLSPQRVVSFMAPFVAERPFRLLVEIGYDFLEGDLRIDLARHPVNPRKGAPSNEVEKIFAGRALSGRRRRLAAAVLPPGRYSLWMHEPPKPGNGMIDVIAGEPGSSFERKVNDGRGWACLGFTWKMEVHVLDPQRAHRFSPVMLHPDLQERLPVHPPLPISLNMAGCLVPTGECELFGIFSVMHLAWNANLPGQNWEENSVAFSIHQTSLVRVHASPHVLGAIHTRAVLRLRLVQLGENEVDLQAPKRAGIYGDDNDSTSDDWLVKQLVPGSYAILINVHYPGTVQAWHAWRMHFPVAFHVAVSKVPALPSGLWGPFSLPGRSSEDSSCGGPVCGLVDIAPESSLAHTGGTWKLHEKAILPCKRQIDRFSPDPSCENGLKSADGSACCPKECTRCGGSECHLLPLGSKACCVSGIKEHSLSCSERRAPCNLFGDGSQVVRTVQLTVTRAEGISLLAETSFGFLHQHLGLLLEGHTVGYSPTGREISREVKYKSMPQFSNAYLDLDLGPGEYNISLVEHAPSPEAHKECVARTHSFLVYAKAKNPRVSSAVASPPRDTAAYDRAETDAQKFGVEPSKLEKWKRVLDSAEADACALVVDLPDTLLPLPKDIRAYRSVLGGKLAPPSSSSSSSAALTTSPQEAARGAALAAETRSEELRADAPAVLQWWGGDDWSRIHADGFNLVRTSAAALELGDIGFAGEGGAFAIRISAPTKTIVRVNAETNMLEEQLLFAVVNAAGDFVSPTAHYPTQYENPALFVIGADTPSFPAAASSASTGSTGGDSGESVSDDPMDQILFGNGKAPIVPKAEAHDYFILLQPKRQPRDKKKGKIDPDNNNADDSGSSESLGRDGAPCPMFSLDLAAAPAHELHDWISQPASTSDSPSGRNTCVEELPEPQITITPAGSGLQRVRGVFTSKTLAQFVAFEIKRPSKLNVALVHNFMTGDFVVGLLRNPEPGAKETEAETIATSEDNVFLFDRSAAIEQARHPSHPMLESHDVGAVLSEDLLPGSYSLKITEHTLRHFPEITGHADDLLCSEFLWEVEIEPLDGSQDESRAFHEDALRQQHHDRGHGQPVPREPSIPPAGGGDDKSEGGGGSEDRAKPAGDEKNKDLEELMEDGVSTGKAAEADKDRGSSDAEANSRRLDDWDAERDTNGRASWSELRRRRKKATVPRTSPDYAKTEKNGVSSDADDDGDVQGFGEWRQKRRHRSPMSEECAEDSCGCVSVYERGEVKCQSIGKCSTHTYGNVETGTYTKILCSCPKNYEGPHCDYCASGYRDYPRCVVDSESDRGKKMLRSARISKDEIFTHPEPVEIKNSRPRFPIMLAYGLTITACCFVLIAILIQLQKKATAYLRVRDIRRSGANALYAYADDGL